MYRLNSRRWKVIVSDKESFLTAMKNIYIEKDMNKGAPREYIFFVEKSGKFSSWSCHGHADIYLIAKNADNRHFMRQQSTLPLRPGVPRTAIPGIDERNSGRTDEHRISPPTDVGDTKPWTEGAIKAEDQVEVDTDKPGQSSNVRTYIAYGRNAHLEVKIHRPFSYGRY
jgi:hypothetical protein